MDRKRTVTRTPAPIFALKKPRMAVFAQPSDLSFAENQDHCLSGFNPRHSLSASSQGQAQMNPIRYMSPPPNQAMTPNPPHYSSRMGQQFQPRVQESPCRPGQSSTRVPLFQPRQNLPSLQPRSSSVGRTPVPLFPPPTRGPRLPLQPPPAKLNPVEGQDYGSRANFSRGFLSYRNKLPQATDVTEPWGSSRLREDVLAPNVERKTPDTSMRLLTTTIDGMKRWANLRDKIPMLFEVFGTVNSAVSGDTTTDAIQFLLKDGQATVNCIFYQIDRTLQRLTRGQWYRCVGRYSGVNSGPCLKCVSIRPIREAEKKHMKALTTAAERAFQALLQESREM